MSEVHTTLRIVDNPKRADDDAGRPVQDSPPSLEIRRTPTLSELDGLRNSAHFFSDQHHTLVGSQWSHVLRRLGEIEIEDVFARDQWVPPSVDIPTPPAGPAVTQ